LAHDSEPGEPARGYVVVPEPNRRIATDLAPVWMRKDGVVAVVPTIDCGDRTAVVEVTKDSTALRSGPRSRSNSSPPLAR
jgi:hypothetical protein